jgi:hypothetical protein
MFRKSGFRFSVKNMRHYKEHEMRRTLFESLTHPPLTEAPPSPDDAPRSLNWRRASLSDASKAKRCRYLP